ncbi:MAG: hypothetical protein ACP5US_08530 [Candidatus Kryptoniota bacterium]
MKKYFIALVVVIVMSSNPAFSQGEDSARVASQNPSPMVEYTRKHIRITEREFYGLTGEIKDILSRPVEIYIPRRSSTAYSADLLIHFHGPYFVVNYAADSYKKPLIACSVNLGAGSAIYAREFKDTLKFLQLIDSINVVAENMVHHRITIKHIILSGFSAGYGAIRQIISYDRNLKTIDAVLLLDGIHASYIPDRRVLSMGGKIDSMALVPFLNFARTCSQSSSRKKFLITHSEIFPGTFVSTTEATDYILHCLGIKIKAVLRWGPLGMQMISMAHRNHFEVLGFAGNSGPDHIDHLHALYYFLKVLMQL